MKFGQVQMPAHGHGISTNTDTGIGIGASLKCCNNTACIVCIINVYILWIH